MAKGRRGCRDGFRFGGVLDGFLNVVFVDDGQRGRTVGFVFCFLDIGCSDESFIGAAPCGDNFDVDAQHHAQAPAPGDAVVPADAAAHHLRDDADTEQDEDHRPGGFGQYFAAHQCRQQKKA